MKEADIEKNLKILAFDKPNGNNEATATFIVDFNPNTFNISNKIEFEKDEGKGKSGGDPVFSKIPPIEFNIEFVIDGTGVATHNLPNENKNKFNNIKQNSGAPNKNDYVKNRVKDLRKVACDINGTIHRPNYLAVLWGTFYIKCILTSLNITYNLFDGSGSPLRAKINCSFLERKEPGAAGRETMMESPDLTKYMEVVEGDMLPLIAKNNYAESYYYLQIAKANKLKNFRNLLPGTQLILPLMVDKDE